MKERLLASSSTPHVLVDFVKVEKNVGAMVGRVACAGTGRRLHIEGHKWAEIAKKRLEPGAAGVTVEKLSEAEATVRAEPTDLLVAYPVVGSSDLRRLAGLTRVAKATTNPGSLDVAGGVTKLRERLGNKLAVLLELDGGKHRAFESQR